jgi:flagellar biosynthesis protein FlhB
MGLKLYYPETDAWHSDHLATTYFRLKLHISTMFTYLQARHGVLETAACWTPLFARGVQNSVSSIETKEGSIRFNHSSSSIFSVQEWVQTIKMLAGKKETLMRFQKCLWAQSYTGACFLHLFTKLISFPPSATTLTRESCDL